MIETNDGTPTAKRRGEYKMKINYIWKIKKKKKKEKGICVIS